MNQPEAHCQLDLRGVEQFSQQPPREGWWLRSGARDRTAIPEAGAQADPDPILRFDQVPGSIEVEVMHRPGLPFLGAGETAQGPTSATLANATGVRLRDMPLTPAKLKAAIGVGA